MRVGIIGGGIAGLTAAYELAKKGHQVLLLEKSPELGGLAGTFSLPHGRLERFYHHLFTTDRDILQLLDELGLTPSLRWLDSKVGIFYDGKVYDFVTPWHLLRFTPVSLLDRLRLGIIALYLERFKDWPKLEGTTARDWIISHAGKRNYEAVWGPLLRGKFGDRAEDIGMVWFWGKIHLRFASRGRTRRKEKLGYIMGSFSLLIEALEREVRKRGGTILTSTEVNRVLLQDGRVMGLYAAGQEHPCDAVIATIPSFAFLKLVPELSEDYSNKLKAVDYLTATCLVLFLKRPLSHIYWLNIADRSLPFAGAIEHTNFIPSSYYGGQHILYLTNYTPASSPIPRGEDVLEEYLPHLKKINPSFTPEWVEGFYFFAGEGGQPIVTPGYSRLIPEHKTPIPGLYLANTTQIYPEDRGTNYSVRLGRRVSQLFP